MFEVVVTAPRQGGEDCLVPFTLPLEVLGCWSADKVEVSALVRAPGHSAAVAAVEALVPSLAHAADAAVTVHAIARARAATPSRTA